MKIIIIGAGFAGLKLARSLNNKPGIEVLLIEKYNYHQFQPLFYQVATGGLDASNISFPLRKLFQRSKNVRIRMAELQAINSQEQTINTNIGVFEYDKLVLACGADTNWFGNQQLIDNAFGMKSTVEALQIRHRMLSNFEELAQTNDPAETERLMNIVIVGGGPTGVEMAGAIAEMKRYVLPRDYPEIDFKQMNIFLLEGGPRTLGPMSEKSSAQSRQYLEELGVTVKTNTILKEYDGLAATLSTGDEIATAMVIWAAGVRGNVPKGIDPSLVARGNRIKVDRLHQVIGLQNIYALGDVAYMETPKYPNGHPQVATVAINQAKNFANNLRWTEMKSPQNLKKFEYHDKGSMATVGRNLAVVDIPKPKLHFGGLVAWLIWMGLHLMLILGVKNKMQVFINWVYNYLTYDQSLRLIFNEFCRAKRPMKQMGKTVQPFGIHELAGK